MTRKRNDRPAVNRAFEGMFWGVTIGLVAWGVIVLMGLEILERWPW